MPQYKIPITQDLRPEYYDQFRCLAADCRFSCCKGWNITFDKKDFLALKRQKGSEDLNHRLETGVRRIREESIFYGQFDMHSGICPLLGEDSLCILQKERGHGALPEVCRTFPRIQRHMPSGYLERSLTPACEGVLALLWELQGPLGFVSDPLPRADMKELTAEGEEILVPSFGLIRECCIDLLQDGRVPLPDRIFLMGAALRELAEGETDMERWAEKSRALPGAPGAAELLSAEEAERTLPLFLSNNIHALKVSSVEDSTLLAAKGEVLTACRIVISTEEDTTTIPLEPYRRARERFEATLGSHPYFMENLMTALFFHLHLPSVTSRELLWKSYVNFCNLYSFCRFMAVMSCREGAAGDREELFRLMVFVSRSLIHNGLRQQVLRDELFRHDSATLAHMAVLLGN